LLIQPSARTLIDTRAATGPIDIANRAWNVYYTVHTRPIVDLWRKINNDVTKQNEKLAEVNEAISQMQLDEGTVKEIRNLVNRRLAPKQQKLSITFIEPSTALGDTLDFTTQEIRTNIERGYTDFVKTMYDAGRLSEQERAVLNGRPIFR
jgi:hypothetical protein